MSKIVTTAAVLLVAFAATAVAQQSQDYRSPDARSANTAQDYRSPDAGPAAIQGVGPAAQDLRSPDARGSGRFLQPARTPRASGTFEWGYLALAIAAALAGTAAVVAAQRRRRHGLAIGG